MKYVRRITLVSAGNDFSLFTGHMSFQIFLLVGHFTNWTGHNLLTNNTVKEVSLVNKLSHVDAKLAGHFQNWVGQRPVTDCYFQPCKCVRPLQEHSKAFKWLSHKHSSTDTGSAPLFICYLQMKEELMSKSKLKMDHQYLRY